MKKPFPISIDKELADWIIDKSKRFRNRSHLVEEAIKDFKKKFDDEVKEVKKKFEDEMKDVKKKFDENE